MVTANRNEKYVTRNASQFKKICIDITRPDVSDEEESEISTEDERDDDMPHLQELRPLQLTRGDTRLEIIQPLHVLETTLYDQ